MTSIGLLASLASAVPAQEVRLELAPSVLVGSNGQTLDTSGRGVSVIQALYGAALLHIPEVRKEIGMTREQVLTWYETQKRLREEKSADIQTTDVEAFRQDRDTREKWETAWQAREEEALNRILTPAQRKRHKQISLQWWGTGVLRRVEVADELRLTPAQRAQIKTVFARYEEKMRKLRETWQQRPTNPQPAVLLPNKVRLRQVQDPTTPYNVMRREMLAVLTPAQKKQWQEMTGPVFKWLAHSRGHDY
jgi:hypothetical protein